MKTTVTELPESRVRVEAEVDPAEVQKALDVAARALGRDMRVPGFRKGKVPPQIILQRVGREAVLDEAVRNALPRWYGEAVTDAKIVPIGDPDLDLGGLPDEGAPMTFSVEIGVRPVAGLGEYKGVEAPRREAQADEEAVQADLDALRERAARLDTVERPAAMGDFVVMDFEGSIDGELFEGGAGRDQLLELGSDRLIPGFEEQLVGASAGDDVTVKVDFPADYGAENLAGKAAEFAVTVKEVKEKVLPELDDAFAEEQAGFDTLDELREDIRAKKLEADASTVDRDFREAVLDVVVANATVEIPQALTDARASELWERMIHSLSHQGIDKQTYLQISGKPEEEILEEAKPEAEQALRRESVVAAIVEAEGIEPSDGDILDALQGSADREKTSPEKLRARLESSGRLEDLKADLAANIAIDLLVEQATAVPATPEGGSEPAAKPKKAAAKKPAAKKPAAKKPAAKKPAAKKPAAKKPAAAPKAD